MSKYVKNLLIDHLRKELDGVSDAVVVSLAGVSSNNGMELRKRLREKNIRLRMVKNSLARVAAKGTSLAPAFDGAAGSSALAFGGEDIVSLAKEIAKLAEDKKFAPFAARGAAIGGELFSAEQVVKEVSKWPSRRDLLAKISGQISGMGSKLSGQLLGIGGKLASQIAKKAEGEEPGADEAAPGDAAAPAGEGAAAPAT